MTRRPPYPAPDRPRFYTVPEAAELLRLSAPTLYRAINAGEFPAVKVRGRYVVPARAIDEMEKQALTTGTVVDAADWATPDQTRSIP